MAKIDFDSDSAPFTGSVLPTIEDVALLSSDDGRYEIGHEKRSDEKTANKAQALLLPMTILVGGLVLVGFYLSSMTTSPQGGGDMGFSDIPFDGAKDIRIIESDPSDEVIEFAQSLVEKGNKVAFFYSKKNTLEKDKIQESGIGFYPVPDGALGGNGVLLDGYKWFPLPP